MKEFFTAQNILPTPTGLAPCEVILRLSFALLFGLLMGGNRERMHRPAGLRTHMLCAVGACCVIMTNEQLFVQYFNYFGSLADPARLSAQIIQGIGFLCAATVFRDGFSVRGLTTAVSLWVSTVSGIIIGAGYYRVALLVLLCTFFTLTAMAFVRRTIAPRGKEGQMELSMECKNLSKMLKTIEGLAGSHAANITRLQFFREDGMQKGTMGLKLRLEFEGDKPRFEQRHFLFELDGIQGIDKLQNLTPQIDERVQPTVK
jgi:putative Mg2+ transporter-C (MgtC) family protein